MQSLWLIIVVFFLVILIVPIYANLHVSYDVLSNVGSLSLFIFGIKIFAYKLKFKGRQLVLMSQKETKDVELELSDKQMRFLEQLNSELKQKVVVKKIAVLSRIGMEDAYVTALVNGIFVSIVNSALAYIKNLKSMAKIELVNEPAYNGKHFTACTYVKFTITIIDLLYSLFMALVIKRRSEKYERI